MQLFVRFLDKSRFLSAVWSAQPGPRGALLADAGIPVFVGRLEEALSYFDPHIVHIHRAGWAQPDELRAVRSRFRPDMNIPGLRLPRIIETNVFGRHDTSHESRYIDTTLLVSHFCARRLQVVEGLAVEPPRYRVLYNPVDTDFFAAQSPVPAVRDYARPIFGRISRADPGKWSTLALESLPIVRETFPHFIFLVIGGTPEAHAFVKEHGLERNVRFLPPVVTDEELAVFFRSISFLAHANDTGESFGLAIAEAMAAGLPVITHPCADWRDNAQVELVEHEKNGLVAETPQGYAAAIVRLLKNPEQCRQFGIAGQERAGALFRVQDIVRTLESVYEEALSLAASRPGLD